MPDWIPGAALGALALAVAGIAFWPTRSAAWNATESWARIRWLEQVLRECGFLPRHDEVGRVRFTGRVASRIRQHREALSLSQSNLAEVVGVGWTDVEHWETKNKPIPAWRLPVIAAALRVSMRDLVGEDVA